MRNSYYEQKSTSSNDFGGYFTSGSKPTKVLFDQGLPNTMKFYKYKEELEEIKIRHNYQVFFDEKADSEIIPFIDVNVKERVETYRKTSVQDAINPVTSQELLTYDSYAKKSKDRNSQLIRALYIFKDTSSEKLWDKVKNCFGTNKLANPTSKFLRELDQWYVTTYGSYNQAADEALDIKFKTVQPFKNVMDFDYGINIFKEIDNEKRSWNTVHDTYQYSTAKCRNWLLKMLKGWDEFAVTRAVLERLPDSTTWSDLLVEAVQQNERLKKSMDPAEWEKVQRESQRYVANLAVNGFNSFDDIMTARSDSPFLYSEDHQLMQAYAARRGNHGINNSRSTSKISTSECFNCKEQGHRFYECTKLYCFKCQLSFKSLTDVNYHHCTQCPSTGNLHKKRPFLDISPYADSEREAKFQEFRLRQLFEEQERSKGPLKPSKPQFIKQSPKQVNSANQMPSFEDFIRQSANQYQKLIQESQSQAMIANNAQINANYHLASCDGTSVCDCLLRIMAEDAEDEDA